MHPWLECGKFLRICRNNFRTTGAILPSSRFLARALVKQLEDLRPPARILEVGPGSGSVTVEIARRMLPGDRLDAVEINGHFARLLKPGGTLSYYEYALVRQLKWPLVDRRERRRLFRVGRVMRGYIRDYQIRRERIFINLPPATVRHLRLKPFVVVRPSEVLKEQTVGK